MTNPTPKPTPTPAVPNKRRFFWPLVVWTIILVVFDAGSLYQASNGDYFIKYGSALYNMIRFLYLPLYIFIVLLIVTAYEKMKDKQYGYMALCLFSALVNFLTPAMIDFCHGVGMSIP